MTRMTSNYTHLTTISTSLQLSPPISNYLCPRATDPAAHYGPRTWALGGQEKKKEAGRGRNKKGRKGDAARQGENIYLIFSFFTCPASVQITQRTHTTTASPPACLSSEDLERRRCAVKEPQQGKPSPRVTGGRTACTLVVSFSSLFSTLTIDLELSSRKVARSISPPQNNNREKSGHQDTALPLQPAPPSSKGRGSDFMTLVRFLM